MNKEEEKPKARSNRNLEYIKAPEKIMYLLEKYYIGNKLLISGYDPPEEVNIIEARKPNHLVIDFKQIIPKIGEIYTFYTVMARYTSIKAKVVQDQINGGHHCLLVIKYVGIASQKRVARRISVRNESIDVGNFRISRNMLSIGVHHIPTSIKLGFSKLKNILHSKADYIEVYTCDEQSSFNNSLIDHICRVGKPILVSDIKDPKFYSPFNSSYFDYASFLGKKLGEKIIELGQKGIVSEIYVPIIYMTSEHTPIPVGCVHLQNKSKLLTPLDVKLVWESIKSMMIQIKKSNTELIAEKEQVIDISRHGLMLLLRKAYVIEALREQQALTFDLIFHMQQPITLYGYIRNFIEKDGMAKVGIQIEGNSSRPKEMDRFNENITVLEAKIPPDEKSNN